jgi:hypothetical protein
MLNLNDTPWHEDRLNRKGEGEIVGNYLVSRGLARLDAGVQDGFVFAIQGEYGEGKSYFLRNLALQLSAKHPVAFIDAWESDTIGTPFMALLNALDTALAPLLRKKSKLEATGRMIGRSGAILGAAVKGGLKKAAEKYIGEEFSEQVADMVSLPETKTKDDGDDHIGEVGSQAIADGMAELANSNEVYALGPKATLDELRLHRQARRALTDLKKALANIVANIRRDNERGAPIFIFVDELDRCSPTYAVSMLEEIKHIFDVPGVIFVLGMQPAQLAMSIKGVYGTDFDGQSYMERLIHYHYALSRSSLDAFINSCLMREPLPDYAFSKDICDRSIAECISAVFNMKGLKPRAVERSIEKMRTAAFAAEAQGLLDPTYLAMRCCETERGSEPLSTPKMLRLEYDYQDGPFPTRGYLETTDYEMINALSSVASELRQYAKAQLKNEKSGGAAAALVARAFYELFDNQEQRMSDYCNDLMIKVASFSRSDVVEINGVWNPNPAPSRQIPLA